MYTCDLCGVDVLDTENLIRVWYRPYAQTSYYGGYADAILVCDGCLDNESDAIEVAEDDPSWDYLTMKTLS